jgi:hypothetical protein
LTEAISTSEFDDPALLAQIARCRLLLRNVTGDDVTMELRVD